MRLATTLSPFLFKTKGAVNDITKNVVAVTIHTKRGKKHFMDRSLPGKAGYNNRLVHFQNALATALTEGMSDEDKEKYSAISVHFESGRKLDKMIVTKFSKGAENVEPEVRYFINKDTEEIFGAKSKLAPNERWYFGTLSTINLWDWSGHHGVPLDPEKAGVREVGKYGDYRHFEKVKAAS